MICAGLRQPQVRFLFRDSPGSPQRRGTTCRLCRFAPALRRFAPASVPLCSRRAPPPTASAAPQYCTAPAAPAARDTPAAQASPALPAHCAAPAAPPLLLRHSPGRGPVRPTASERHRDSASCQLRQAAAARSERLPQPGGQVSSAPPRRDAPPAGPAGGPQPDRRRPERSPGAGRLGSAGVDSDATRTRARASRADVQ